METKKKLKAVRYAPLPLMAGVAVAAGYRHLLKRALPAKQGMVWLDGLRDDVQIWRDQWGVPHVYAQSLPDLLFGQGFVHAQDRLWQMEFQRRVSAGTLCEVFGRRALAADRLMRRMGFRRAAEVEANGLNAEPALALRAYVRGINAYLACHQRRLPLEFTLFHVKPRPWTTVDSLAWHKFMAWSLSPNWDTEILRSYLLDRLGPEVAATVEPRYPGEMPVTVPSEGSAAENSSRNTVTALLAEYREAQPFLGPGAMAKGSNSWVVDGTLSSTGKPLLANDPHLVIQMPSVWYQNHLCGADLDVVGVSLLGLPGVVIGHNQQIAWGITASCADVQDVYVEQFAAGGSRRYRHGEEWREAKLIKEAIRVRGQGKSEIEEVLVTIHGPVISPVIPGETRQLALRSNVLEPGTTLKGMLQLNRAGNWSEFRAALRDWHNPVLNFTYADVDGNIGYQLAGRVPVRASGCGLVPAAGWTGHCEWDGYIPFSELPYCLNPADHYVVSANHCIVDECYPHFISREWVDGFRAQRIIELLSAKSEHSLADFAAYQGDVLSVAARQLVSHIDRLRPADDWEATSLSLIRGWDCTLRIESAAAAVYEVFRQRLLYNTFGPKLGDLVDLYLGKGLHDLLPANFYQVRVTSFLLQLLAEMDANWFPPDAEGRRETWPAVLQKSLTETVLFLRKKLGHNPARWQWGALHQAVFAHPLGQLKPLAPILNRGPFPVGGDIDTVFQTAFLPNGRYEAVNSAVSYRQIIDLADVNRSVAATSSGQSGQPGSRHYGDLIDLWLRGECHPMLYERAEIEAASVGKLTLRAMSAARSQ